MRRNGRWRSAWPNSSGASPNWSASASRWGCGWPQSYADKEKLQPALLREAALRLELERAEEEWLALQAELEQLA